jgi:hypothetical protein
MRGRKRANYLEQELQLRLQLRVGPFRPSRQAFRYTSQLVVVKPLDASVHFLPADFKSPPETSAERQRPTMIRVGQPICCDHR